VGSVSWRAAMTQALYGDGGFFTRAVAAEHFRTSALASPLFATALLRLVVATDEALGRPPTLDVVDMGAGSGDLLRRLAVLAPAYLASRLRLVAVDVAPRPASLPEQIAWEHDPPPAGSVNGVLLATEWLDNVPLDVAEVDAWGVLRYVLVDPEGNESTGDMLTDDDMAWATRWWSHAPWETGTRVELGGPRDMAWADVVASVSRGLAITVDYGHFWYDRPPFGTLTGFYAGRSATPVPDGSRDITAHVAVDSACSAGEERAGQPAALATQRDALTALGVNAQRPPVSQAASDPAGYVRGLSAATQAAELMDSEGLGAHLWILQPIGIDSDALPAALRP
jgi:SAM-dependent MidA family methyltransferase